MYYRTRIEDTIRIPPNRFGEDFDSVIKDIVQKTFEGKVRRQYGVIVVVDNIEPIGDGVIIHGDGSMYQRVAFDAIVFKPELQEIVDGIVCEIVEFGAFSHIGPIDALIHMSQIMNDYVEVDSNNEIITGKEKKLMLKNGDTIRARIVAVSLNELSARESKIGLTMRQPALGAHHWIYAPPEEKKEGKKKEKEEGKGKK